FISHKGSLPFEVTAQHGALVSPNGDTLISVNERAVTSLAELEFVIDSYEKGNNVVAVIAHHGERTDTSITLIPAYTTASVFVRAFCGLLYLVFAIIILIKRPEETAARVVNIASIAAAIVILDTW